MCEEGGCEEGGCEEGGSVRRVGLRRVGVPVCCVVHAQSISVEVWRYGGMEVWRYGSLVDPENQWHVLSPDPLPNGVIDPLVIQCVSYLNREHILDEEGLFRVPGDVATIRRLRGQFVMGKLLMLWVRY